MKKQHFTAKRLLALQDLLKARKLDSVLLTSRHAVSYFSDFLDEGGFLYVTRHEARFFTDSRYISEARALQGPFSKEIIRNNILSYFKAQKVIKEKRIGFEGGDVTHTFFGYLAANFSGKQYVDISPEINDLCSIHDEESLRRFRKAAAITKEALYLALNSLQGGVTEKEIANEIMYGVLALGGDSVAFPPIVAFGKNAANPHARPGAAKLKKGDVVLIDMGACFKGINCDITRTFFYGEKEPKGIGQINTCLLEIHREVKKLILPGASVADLDIAARGVMKQYGLEEHFLHSLGHGLGYLVHQVPRISMYSQEKLIAGQIITIEPGIYISGKYGFRHEECYLVGDTPKLLTDF